MIYCFDLDGTICTQTGPGKYHLAEPIPEVVDLVNKLYDQGHTIKIYTARGMGMYKGAIHAIYENMFELTKGQLSKWNLNYHSIFLGKPDADFYIDDRAVDLKELLDSHSD